MACEYGVLSELRSFGVQAINLICKNYRGKELYADQFQNSNCTLKNGLKNQTAIEESFNKTCAQRPNCTFEIQLDDLTD